MRIAISTPVYPLPGDLTRGRYMYEIARCLSKLATVEIFFHTGRYPRTRWLRPRSFVATSSHHLIVSRLIVSSSRVAAGVFGFYMPVSWWLSPFAFGSSWMLLGGVAVLRVL